MKRTNLLLAVGIAAVCCSLSSAKAQYVTTLTKAESVQGILGGQNELGMPFTTDAAAVSYTLDSVRVRIRADVSDTLTGDLYLADGSSLPTGPSLASFTHGAVGGALSDVTFTPVGSITLNPSTTYVFGLSSSAGSQYTWSGTAAGNFFDQPAGGNWSMPAVVAASTDGGTSWGDAGAGGFRFHGAVFATPVPEPTTYAVVTGLALLGFAGIRRRRNRAKQLAV